MHIDDYSFGSMTVDGKTYNKDLILFSDRIKENWYRDDGHLLTPKDLTEVIAFKPKILVIGTGHDGVMKIAPETREELKKLNITLVDKMTGDALETFNDYIAKGENVVGGFHLTC